MRANEKNMEVGCPFGLFNRNLNLQRVPCERTDAHWHGFAHGLAESHRPPVWGSEGDLPLWVQRERGESGVDDHGVCPGPRREAEMRKAENINMARDRWNLANLKLPLDV